MGGNADKVVGIPGARQPISKEELLRPRIHTTDVYIESLPGWVKIRSLSHGKRQEINNRSKYGQDGFDSSVMTLLSIVESLVEPKLNYEDLEKLAEQSTSVIDELSIEITKLNMLGATEELKKDSEVIPISDSPSTSPSDSA